MVQSNQDKDAYTLTLGDIFFVPMTTPGTSATAPVYDKTVYRKTIGKKVEVKGNGKSTPLYASGVLLAQVNQETSEEISMDHIGLPTVLLDKLTAVTANNGVSFATADATTPAEFAFGFIAKQSDGVDDAMWFPRCSVSSATELSYETSEDEFKEQDVSMTINASGLLSGDHIIFSKYSSQRDTTLTVEDFMKQVVYDKGQIATLGKPDETVTTENSGSESTVTESEASTSDSESSESAE
ncbi:phage tail protein [Levilactobacillus namurensis]|uniref:phage tail protein n=1 Tax=Levilactobacillus namurensis TaxID=380393 RepID=UPI00223243F0|nr:phage tail protein [Levilactobacillus namurensis]MCW3778511.1 phage tail protein [Levilactobacillus namurensis]MDT7019568.1 phage tail protein [Levilactobacillus namurensis]WNN65844.1 phage tail protein [Levilactobacillus namurensis]